ncbi:MAG: amidohydrolase family protein [Gemmatimonadaceae bacterium]
MRTPTIVSVTAISGRSHKASSRGRGFARLAALVIPLAVLACKDDVHPVAPLAVVSHESLAQRREGPIVLRGTIITPTGVMKHGYVAVMEGRILSVSEKQPDIAGALLVNTEGIILPGFVDIHNHLMWNVLPRWTPSRTFSNQPEWAQDPEYLEVRQPVDELGPSHFCDMNAWGELRALVGGTTAIMATSPRQCVHGLVRNLDFNSGFYGTTELDREHIYNVAPGDFPPPTNLAGRAQFAAVAGFFIANPFYEALVMHVAEGTDAVAQEQFTFLHSQGLLNPKGVLIHGISLDAADFQSMAAAGTALVWSPRSNLELFGVTADLDAALDAGVEIALAPDWALTGSSNMLNELKVAARWNSEHLGGRLTNRQLVDMATSAAARAVGVQDEVGAIVPGLRADLLVVRGDINDALQAIIDADARDVELVMIGGVPLYGSRGVVAPFWAQSDLEKIALPGAPKFLATPAAGLALSEVGARLSAALLGHGVSLAPLTEMPAR